MNGIKKAVSVIAIGIFMLSAVRVFANSTTTCSYYTPVAFYGDTNTDITWKYIGTPTGGVLGSRPMSGGFASSTCVTVTDPVSSSGGADYTEILRAIASSTEAQAYTFDHTVIYNGLMILSVYFFGFIYYFKRKTQI